MARYPTLSLLRAAAFRTLRAAFRMLPLRQASRDGLRQWFLSRLSWLLPDAPRGRQANAWSLARSRRRVSGDRAIGYREASRPALPKRLPARLVAFYLPQFHPIPENDAAWGEGFTEWRNVNRAKPQFEGHYQPRLAGELGDYDLLDPAVMRRQVELAHRYGIGAFAFYFYWFNGRSPLETPLLRWLEDPACDLPFCLCWANESWTRRWDGRDHEVILGQSHSAEDDLAFIRHVATYLTDPRYLRVDGRPVLVIYRPSLFPDIRATANRWRAECRRLGVGELHLCYVQGFERPDPRDIGFDAAIEFPPNMVEPKDVTHLQRLINPRFQGKAMDWRGIPAHAVRDSQDYLLYPGVNPGWDNEPRRPGRGRALIHASPRRYRDWLVTAIHRAKGRGVHDLVFVNAWNEWAEGAVLEPDRRLGHAWLHATSQALRIASSASSAPAPKPPPVALVHAWYAEEFAEILGSLAATGIPWRLVVTTSPERETPIRAALEQAGLDAEIVLAENRGRDILPFLRTADHLLDEGVDIVLKIHTKRSTHRGDGSTWRSDMLERLIAPSRAARILEAFSAEPELGMVAPEGHVLPMRTYLSANRNAIDYLVTRLGFSDRRYVRERFVAGTMFWCRLEALRPLLDSHLEEWEFEGEAGQLDGTLAHAIERLFALCVRDAGFKMLTAAEVCGESARDDRPYPYAEPGRG